MEEDLIVEQRVMGKEHKAWIQMFETIVKIFELKHNELNKKKYRPIFEQIERWSYFDRLRRNYFISIKSKYADNKGLFWNGKD